MKSIGIDIVEIDRIQIKPEFINRFFTKEEIKKVNTFSSEFKKKRFLASRWALKEAIYKALPNEHLVFNEINISENQLKQPIVKIKNYQINLSLSHNQTSVVAIAICF